MSRTTVSSVAAALLLSAPGVLRAQQPAPGPADTVSITLDGAVERALSESDEVRLAHSEVGLAGAQVRAARAQALPQLSANLGYTRTFASPFGGGGGGISLPDSLRFDPDTTASLALPRAL